LGLGITNLCPRATARAEELTAAELARGGRAFAKKVRTYRPDVVAVLGVAAYRHAFDRAAARVGRQAEDIGGRPAWVLPNPSGLNAHYGLPALALHFRELRETLESA
ncbi:MAG TPA: mismatch-specific DNA-glycosylase, partial [Vicinamibacteria bacterium]|nr:mismatch-specific DNA-glycosylase [Vicinamibacteria bacterium]